MRIEEMTLEGQFNYWANTYEGGMLLEVMKEMTENKNDK